MEKLEELQISDSQYIKDFRVYFKNIIHSDNKLLNIVLNYVLKHNGKQFRPRLVFLSAEIAGKVEEKTYVAASLIELLHTATLVHDDVVDNSQLRRGVFTIKYLWKSKIAVLLGDYLLSEGLLLSIKSKSYDILEIVSEAVKEMSEGELMQIEKSRTLNLDIEQYYQIIYKKTGSLISSATEAGARSATTNEDIIARFKQIGRYIGIAFQIKDDLLDFEGTSVVGKPIGNDIQESKMTLPIIYSIQNSERTERKKIMRILGKNKKTKKEIEIVRQFVFRNGGIDFATKELNNYISQAKEELYRFDQTVARDELIKLVEYVAMRKK